MSGERERRLTEPRWVADLRRRATGGKSFMACRHIDIDDRDRSPNSEHRQCVLDRGEPERCEMTSEPASAWHVTDKTKCDYWRRLRAADPAGCSPEEALRLISEIDRLRSQIMEAKGG